MSESNSDQQSLEMAIRGLTAAFNGAFGNESAMGGFSTGFFPTPMQAQLRRDEMYRSQNYAEATRLDEFRAATLTRTVGDFMTGGNGEAYMKQNPWMRSVVSRVADSPMFAQFLGGRQQDLAQGVASAVGVSGMQLSNNRLFGYGAATNAVARQLTSDIQNSFFNRNTGAARLEMTQGFDRTELGAIVNTLGRQGAFAGMDIGKMVDEGNTHRVRLDESAKARIIERVQGVNESLRTLRDIVGDKSVAELMNIGQSLVGTGVGTPGAAAMLSHRLNRIGAASDATGTDVRRNLEFTGGLTRMYEGLGLGKTAAADAAYATGLASTERVVAARETAARLGLGHAPSAEEMAAVHTQQTMAAHRYGGEHDALVAIEYTRSRLRHDKSKMEQANRLEAILSQPWSRSRDFALATAYETSGFGNMIGRMGGRDAVMRNLTASQRESISNRMESLLGRDEESGAYATATGGTNELSLARRWKFEDRNNLLKALGGTADWINAMEGKTAGFNAEQKSALASAIKTYGQGDVTQFLNQAATTAHTSGRLVLSAEQKRQFSERNLASFTVRGFSASGPEADMAQTFYAALTGEKQSSAQMAAQYLLSRYGNTQGGPIARLSGMTKSDLSTYLKANAPGLTSEMLGNADYFTNGVLNARGIGALRDRTGGVIVNAEQGSHMVELQQFLEGKLSPADYAKSIAARGGMKDTGRWKSLAAIQTAALKKDEEAQGWLKSYEEDWMATSPKAQYLVGKHMLTTSASAATFAQSMAAMGLSGNKNAKLRGIFNRTFNEAGEAYSLEGLELLDPMRAGTRDILDSSIKSSRFMRAFLNTRGGGGSEAGLAIREGVMNASQFKAYTNMLTPLDRLDANAKLLSELDTMLKDKNLGDKEKTNINAAYDDLRKNAFGGMGEFVGTLRVIGENITIGVHKQNEVGTSATK